MTEARRNLPETWEPADVTRVVRALQHSGPQRFGDLPSEPELAGWPEQRIQDAVVSAWSHNLISIDPHDLLVAL